MSGRYRLVAFGERNQPFAKGPRLSKGSESSKSPQVSAEDKHAWIMPNARRLPDKNLSASANTGVSHSGYCRRLEFLEPYGEKISRLRTS